MLACVIISRQNLAHILYTRFVFTRYITMHQLPGSYRAVVLHGAIIGSVKKASIYGHNEASIHLCIKTFIDILKIALIPHLHWKLHIYKFFPAGCVCVGIIRIQVS